jgi:hypothetical protein
MYYICHDRPHAASVAVNSIATVAEAGVLSSVFTENVHIRRNIHRTVSSIFIKALKSIWNSNLQQSDINRPRWNEYFFVRPLRAFQLQLIILINNSDQALLEIE